MSSNLVPSEVAILVGKLDPSRNYGDRSFDDVVKGIYSGEILIAEGNNLPMLTDASTNLRIKGTGRPILGANDAQHFAVTEFRKHALDDFEWAYENLKKGMDKGDPRYDKIFWEILGGKQGELRGGGMIAEAFKAVIEAMNTPEERRIEAYEVD